MKLPFVISVPHCSDWIPEAIEPSLGLSSSEIADSVDWGTKEIFGSLDAAHVVWARCNRLVVDLNRDPDRTDAMGVIPKIDYFRRSVYRQGMYPDTAEMDRRLREYYHPYHRLLRQALRQIHIKGLYDGHSLTGIGPSGAPDAGKRRKDIVLSNNGDPDGEYIASLGNTTCPAGRLHVMKRVFERAGFSVSLNDPYSGGYITTHYGRTLASAGKFAVQVEVNQDLFTEAGNEKPLPEKLLWIGKAFQCCFNEIASKL